jgi:hypothetical protein
MGIMEIEMGIFGRKGGFIKTLGWWSAARLL